MDPNTTLLSIRELATRLSRPPADLDNGYTDEEGRLREDAADDLANSVVALDEWLARGGCLPKVWAPGARS